MWWQGRTDRPGCWIVPRLSNTFWMVVSLASTMTRLSSNIRTFMDSHLEDIHSGWSTQTWTDGAYNETCWTLLAGSHSLNTDRRESGAWEASQQSSQPSWTSQSNRRQRTKRVSPTFLLLTMSHQISDLLTGAVRVWQHQAGANDVEGGIDMHGIRILEWDDVDVVVRRQMTPHPFNSHEICNLWHIQSRIALRGTTTRRRFTDCALLCSLRNACRKWMGLYLAPLHKQIPPSSNEISSVEAGLVLSGHKLALSCQLVSVLHCADWIVLKETRLLQTAVKCIVLS